MKYFRIIVTGVLLAATGVQGYFAVQYRLKIAELNTQSAALNAQTTKLSSLSGQLSQQTDQVNAWPKPYAEICGNGLRDRGFTNVQCLVWGEWNGKMLGFMINSNDVTVLPGMSLRMQQIDPEDLASRKKL